MCCVMAREHRLHRRHRVYDEHSVLDGARQQHTISGTNRAPLTQQTRNRPSPPFGSRELTFHTAPHDHRVPRAPRPNTIAGSPAQRPQHTTLTHPATRINSRDPIGHRARTGRRQRRHRKPRNPTTSRSSHRNEALDNTLRSGFRRHDLSPRSTLAIAHLGNQHVRDRTNRTPSERATRPTVTSDFAPETTISSANPLRSSLGIGRASAAGVRCQQTGPKPSLLAQERKEAVRVIHRHPER